MILKFNKLLKSIYRPFWIRHKSESNHQINLWEKKLSKNHSHFFILYADFFRNSRRKKKKTKPLLKDIQHFTCSILHV